MTNRFPVIAHATADALSRPAGLPDEQTAEVMRAAILTKLTYAVGKNAGGRQQARLVRRHRAGRARPHRRSLDGLDARDLRGERKRVYYLSLEFLIGRLLRDALTQSRADRDRARGARRASASISTSCARSSPTPRSAMAASAGSPPASWRAWRRSRIAAYGYGIRYDHGLFRQVIKDGWQQEYPEDWLSFGNPWEFERPEVAYDIGFGGTVEAIDGADGTVAPCLAAGGDGRGGRLRHAGGRLARRGM